VGGSNSILMDIQLANALAPGTLHPTATQSRTFNTIVTDVVIKDGAAQHVTYGMVTRQDADWSNKKSAFQKRLSEAPRYDGGAIRITHFSGQYWPNVDVAMEVISANQEWKEAVERGNVVFVTQISQWYLVCGVYRLFFCNRMELASVGGGVRTTFKKEMQATLGRMTSFCGKGGPAGEFGCTVLSNAYDSKQSWNIRPFNQIIAEVMDEYKTPLLRYLDAWTLGEAAPTETIKAHNTPMLINYIWQVIHGNTCVLTETKHSDAIWAIFEGGSCFENQVPSSLEVCPLYKKQCGDRCDRWECAHGPQCVLKPLDGSGVSGKPEVVTTETKLPGESTTSDVRACSSMPTVHFHTTKRKAPEDCKRVWCAEDLEVILTIWGVLGILGAVCAHWYGHFRKKGASAISAMASTSEGPHCGAQVVGASSARNRGNDVHPYTDVREQDSAGDSELSLEVEQWPDRDCLSPTRCVSPTRVKSQTAPTDVTVVDLEVKSEAISKLPEEGKLPDSLAHAAFQDCHQNISCVEQGTLRDASHASVDIMPAPKEPKGKSEESTSSGIEAGADSKKSFSIATSLFSVTSTDGRFPLGLSRFLASLHIVAGHLYQGGHIADVYLFSWGFTWVPWFFMLSGFVLFSANAKRPTKENALEYVRRRSVTIWPLYAVSLLPMFVLSKVVYSPSGAPGGGYLVAQTLLMQSWVPWLTEHTLQLHCWFLSCMVVYWLCFKPVYRCVSSLSFTATTISLLASFLLPWIVAVVIPAAAGDVEWYQKHRTGKTDTFTDIAVVLFKFHPLSYFHVFLSGMLVAHLRLLFGAWDSKPLQIAFHFLAPISYVLLLVIFTVEPLKPWGFKLAARLSVLLPLQAGILLGMAGLPKQPLPFLAALAMQVEFLADYSYAVYIFQFFCKKLWPTADNITIWFFVFLIGTAAAAVHLVQRPAQNIWKKLPWQVTVVIPVVWAVLLFGLSFIDDVEKPATSTLPDVIDHGGGAVDWRLGLNIEGLGAASLINPSVAVSEDQLVVAARQHSRSWTEHSGEYQGEAVTVVSQVWHSDIVIGIATLDHTWQSGQHVPMKKWSSLRKPHQSFGSAPWGELCVVETYIPENRTLLRKVVTGPEDPRLLLYGGASGVDHLAVSFNSLPPLGMHGCAKGYSVSQMYLAPKLSLNADASPTIARRIQCGYTRIDEKNWIPFSRHGKIYFVYSPQPHEVAVVREDGACQVLYTSSFTPLQNLLAEHASWRARGSAQAVYVNDSSSTASLPKPHFLSLLHIFDKATGKYAHFAYRFNPEPPFQVWQLSAELRLETLASDVGGVSFAFASGLAVHHGKVVITYGAGDSDARALVMPLAKLEKDYFSSECTHT